MNSMRIVIIVLLLAVAINALAAGYSFITDPSGSGVKTSVEILRFSPFHDFFIPGLVLFCVNGLMNVFAAICLVSGWRHAYLFVMIQGLLLTGWIIIQVVMLYQFNVLHAVFAALGMFLVFTGLYMYNRNPKGLTVRNVLSDNTN